MGNRRHWIMCTVTPNACIAKPILRPVATVGLVMVELETAGFAIPRRRNARLRTKQTHERLLVAGRGLGKSHRVVQVIVNQSGE
ncbi:MAG: hypothetical protein ACKVKG_11315 [Alphaproteobacteria bacterium]